MLWCEDGDPDQHQPARTELVGSGGGCEMSCRGWKSFRCWWLALKAMNEVNREINEAAKVLPLVGQQGSVHLHHFMQQFKNFEPTSPFT